MKKSKEPNVDDFYKLMMDIAIQLKDVRTMSDEKLDYNRSRWIDRGTEEKWWSSPMDYEYDTDVQSLAIQIWQMLKFDRIIKDN